MRCIARNNKGERCGNKAEIKKLFFCLHHNFLKSGFFFIKNPILKYVIATFCMGSFFILYTIFSTEISDYWKSSNIRNFVFGQKKSSKSIEFLKFNDSNSFNILLIPFGSSQSCNNETILCERELKKYFLTSQSFKDANVKVLIDYSVKDKLKVFTEKELFEKAKNSMADIIIWGDYTNRCNFDTTWVQVNYYITQNKNSNFISLDKYETSGYHPILSVSEIYNGNLTGDIKNIAFWTMGYKEFDQKNYNKAIQNFLQVKTVNNKEYAQLYHSIGLSYQEINDYRNSILYYSKALALDSSFYWSYNNRGNCFVNIQEFDKAIEDFNKVISITNGKCSDAFLNRGILYREKGNLSKAMDDFNQSMRVWANYGGSKDLFNLISMNRGILICQEGHIIGIQDIENALKYDPENEDLYVAKAICSLLNNNSIESENIINYLLMKDPKSFKGLLLKYDICNKLGKTNKANEIRNDLKKTLSIGEEKKVLADFYGYKIYL